MPKLHSRAKTGQGQTISLRASSKQKALIDQAADALGRSRSDFMLDTACREAESVLLDRRYFTLPGDAFRQFTEMLDKPPKSKRKLARLLQSTPVWEK